MSNPSNPNYKPGVGRLVTDRFDFQKHVDGYSFNHKASQINLNTAITINSVVTHNVQDALTEIAEVAFGSGASISDATTSIKGIIQLAGDIGGTSTNVKVVKLQGFSVSSTPPTSNQVLMWNGSAWLPSSLSSIFIAAGDLSGSNTTQSVIGLRGRSVASTAPSTNQLLGWNGSAWTPTTIVPTSTGFATVTSGAFDSAATTNIRYTGGKFQTDANIQFKNSAITGDLVWVPTTSNKTITLPDVTDTLVGRTTTDTLISKTINATNNTITDTSTAAGDLLSSNGTKFIRLAKGSNGTFLGVQSGVLGYYTPSGGGSTAPTGTGFATVTSGSFDSAATVNIRYTGGKFQTDVGLQFKSSTLTGDLVWSIASTNKTLTLPDITDTLVTKTTTDTLTNKTISVGTNSLVAATNTAGDILKNNGTSYQRFAKGTSLQVLRVNSGATDLEWATLTTASAGIANSLQLSDGSGGFLANTSVGLSSGGSLKINLTGSALEMAVPISGYTTTSQSFKMTMATVNATTVSGPYTPTSSQIACPFWVITNASNDGYINMPNQSQSMYFIINDTGSTCYFRAATSGAPDLSFTVGQKGVIYHTGTTYRILLVQ